MLVSPVLVTCLLAFTSFGSALAAPSNKGKNVGQKNKNSSKGSRPDVLTAEAAEPRPWLKQLKKLAKAQTQAYVQWKAALEASPNAGSQSGSSPVPQAAPPSEAQAAPSVGSTSVPLAEQKVAAAGIPVGQVITSCIVPGTVALTFDDGPYIHTPKILDLFRDNNVKGTFFVNGQNFASINEPANQATVRRIVDEGHLLAHHTWSHPDLSTLDKAGIVSQFKQLEDALINIVGRYPTYFRAPFFSANALVLQTAGELGYHVVNADIDSKDYENLNNMQVAVQKFNDGLNAGGSILLAHDVHQATADTLVPAMIAEVKKRGLRAVTVAECLGDPPANWYRTR